MAVFVSPRLTNEEIYLAQKFARVVLGTNNVARAACEAHRMGADFQVNRLQDLHQEIRS